MEIDNFTAAPTKVLDLLGNLDGQNENNNLKRKIKATSVLAGTITLSASSAACCLFCIIWAATSWTDDEECEDEYTWLLVEGIVGLCYLGFKSTIAVAKCVRETYPEHSRNDDEKCMSILCNIVKCCGTIGQIIYSLFTLGWAIYGMILFFDGGYDGGYIEGGQCFKLHAVGFVYSIIQCCMIGLGVILGILVGIIIGILGVVAAARI